MTDSALVWIVLFAIAALLFFGAAAIIAVIGTRDLRDLVRKSHRSD
jgi:hypothetical protein